MELQILPQIVAGFENCRVEKSLDAHLFGRLAETAFDIGYVLPTAQAACICITRTSSRSSHRPKFAASGASCDVFQRNRTGSNLLGKRAGCAELRHWALLQGVPIGSHAPTDVGVMRAAGAGSASLNLESRAYKSDCCLRVDYGLSLVLV